ncbi:MAG: hypothetical protein M1840_002753, partial [Geoglossum simile]
VATTSPAHFPFLSLPAELRRLIYRHLIPNLTVQVLHKRSPQSPFREDGDPCCPAILRVNRMVNEEVLEMWYGSVFYSVELRANTVYLLNQTIEPRGLPPSVFQAVRFLKVKTVLANRRSAEPDGPAMDQGGFREGVSTLACCLSAMHRLKRLDLTLALVPTWFCRKRVKPDDIRQVLVWNLDPLRTVRGLSEVRTEIVVPQYVAQVVGFSENFVSTKTEYTAIARAFMDAIEREMVLASPRSVET